MSKVIFEVNKELKKELNIYLAEKELTAKEFFTQIIIKELKGGKQI